jgi:hypothetical protein
MIAATLDVDAGPVLDYIEQVRRATGVRVTPAHLVGRAAAKVTEALPGLNGRVVSGRSPRRPPHERSFKNKSWRAALSWCTDYVRTCLAGGHPPRPSTWLLRRIKPACARAGWHYSVASQAVRAADTRAVCHMVLYAAW